MTVVTKAGGSTNISRDRVTGEPQCYLDMDGLLADLFDTVAKRLHRKKYADTTQGEREITRSLWLEKTDFSTKVGDVEDLFANLSPYSTNTELLDLVCERFGGFHICSHPARIDPEACIRGKQEWIRKHILPGYGDYLRGVHFPDKKEQFAVVGGVPNLLIDDYSPYIKAWIQAGGKAIRVRADKFSSGDGFRVYLLAELTKTGL